MEISKEEAGIIYSALGDKDGEISEEELMLEKRIRKEYPATDEKLKKSERRDHLWKHEVEDDKRVKKARRRLDKHTRNDIYGLKLDDLMKMKKVVLHELLETEEE